MPSDVDLCNVALGAIGADAVVAAIDPPDGSIEAGHCARVYPIARRELMDFHPWTFGKKRVELAQVANPSTVWGYAYQLPSDCLNALRVLTLEVITDAGYYPFLYPFPLDEELGFYTERGTADFEIEGGVLLTQQPQAVLLYTTDVVDLNRVTPSFFTALAMLTSSYLAGPIIKGLEGANTMARLRESVYGPDGKTGLAGTAAKNDANNGAEHAEYFPASLAARA